MVFYRCTLPWEQDEDQSDERVEHRRRSWRRSSQNYRTRIAERTEGLFEVRYVRRLRWEKKRCYVKRRWRSCCKPFSDPKAAFTLKVCVYDCVAAAFTFNPCASNVVNTNGQLKIHSHQAKTNVQVNYQRNQPKALAFSRCESAFNRKRR